MNTQKDNARETFKEMRMLFSSAKYHRTWGLTTKPERGCMAIVETENRSFLVKGWVEENNGIAAIEVYPGIHCAQPYRLQVLDYGRVVERKTVGSLKLKENGTVYAARRVTLYDAPVTIQELYVIESDLLRFISKIADDIDCIAHGRMTDVLQRSPEAATAALCLRGLSSPNEDEADALSDEVLDDLIERIGKQAVELERRKAEEEKTAQAKQPETDLFPRFFQAMQDDTEEE